MLLQTRWFRSSWCIAWIAAALSALPAFAQNTVEDLYAITADKKLLRIDLDTGAGALVATLNVQGSPYGMASMKLSHGESALLWIITTSNHLYRVDPYSGKLLMTNALSLPAATGGGFAAPAFFSPDFSIAQTLNSTGSLIRLDLIAGTSIVVGALSPPMEGIETSYDGKLYGLSAGSSPSFYRIDRTNAATTLIGSLGIDVPGFSFGGLAMHGGLPGLVYAVVSSVNESRLYELDATGTAMLRGQIGFPRVTGMALHVRQPGPLSIRRSGTNVMVSWPATNGGYLLRKTDGAAFGVPVFNPILPATNRLDIFYLSPHPPF